MRTTTNDLSRSPPAGAAMSGWRSLRQKDSVHDERAPADFLDVAMKPLRWLARMLVAVHFRRLVVGHPERFPHRGAVLMVANHPATWTDVIVLEAALARPLRFLAHESLFRPRPRAWVLRLHGALPVASPAPGTTRNVELFRRCAELLTRGQVVAMFPEGRSGDDRSLAAFKTGAARIALDRLSAGGALTILPVGLHYSDRCRFGSDVVVGIGRPIPVAWPPEQERMAGVAALTRRMRRAIAGQMVAMDPAMRAAVEELAAMAPDEPSDPGALRRSRAVARGLARWRRRAPVAYLACVERVDRQRRLRVALRVRPFDVEASEPRARARAAIGLVPALAGLVMNAPSAALTEWCVRRMADPTRVTLVRMLAGLVWFPAWYSSMAALAIRMSGRWWTAPLVVAVAAVAGGLAVRRRTWDRLSRWRRLAVAKRRHPRAMAEILRERGVIRAVACSLAAGLPEGRAAAWRGRP